MKNNNPLKRKPRHLITRSLPYTMVFVLLTVCLQPTSLASMPHLALPAEPVTMITHDGDASYFDIELSNVPPNLDVVDGVYEGWCADRFVVMPRNQPLTVQLSNNYDQPLPPSVYETWCKVNDILNHHEGATPIDVQGAFWYLLCDYPYTSLSSTAQALVDNAQNDFIPQPGDLIAIFADPVQNNSNPWPFQYSFLAVQVPIQEAIEPPEPTQPTRISHGYRYNDQAPQAITNGPYNGFTNEPIEFSGIQSYDPDGIIIHYHWAFGDGTTAETITTTHTYTNKGTYPVSLTVIDNFGLRNTQTVEAVITKRNSAPTPATIIGPTEGTTNIDYSYAFHADDVDNDLITYQITWGDGTTQTKYYPSGDYFAVQHHWTTPGTYTITVTTSDASLQSTSTHTIQIKELPITENICILGLALLALILLLALWLLSRKAKNKQ